MNKISEILQQKRPFLLLENTLPAYADEHAWLFTEPLCEIKANNREAFFTALSKIDLERQKGHYLAGYISYEAGYALSSKLSAFLDDRDEDTPLLHFFVFDSVERVATESVTQALNALPESDPYIQNWQPTETEAEYVEKLEKIHQYISAGDTYQVNHTYRVNFDLVGSVNGLYKTLRQRQPVAFSALMHLPERSILSLSPELFIRKQGTTLSTKPMKGTMPRGKTPEEDAAILKAMSADEKQQSENLMIVDLMRNDIGHLANPGSMKVSRLFEIQTYKTLHQMISSIEGQVAKEMTFAELINGLFPCGSITGAPKIRTMEIIHELENTPRDIYTGAIGFITPDNDFTFNVPIRTISFPKGSQRGTLGVGGGIIYESDARDEWRESQLKARFITGINQDFKLIETCRYDAATKEILRLDQHLARLARSADYFRYPFDFEQVQSLLQQHINQQTSHEDRKIRCLLDAEGQVEISSEVLPEMALAEHCGAGDDALPKVCLSSTRLDESNLFRQHKTTNRALYNSAFNQAVAEGFYDVLFLNQQDYVAEASRHNVFIQQDSVLYTPPISDGALPGVMRDTILSRTDKTVSEKHLTLEDLASAEHIYLSNSVRGLVEVELIQS